MKSKKFFAVLLAALPLLIGVQSCSGNSESQVDGEKTSATDETSGEEKTEVTSAIPADPMAKFDPDRKAALTDSSKFLAGISVDDGSKIASLQDSGAWLNNANFLDSAWAKLEGQQIGPARDWAADELKSINSASPKVFYPFGGPDFLYAYTFFPEATEYIQIGLEPVGDIPEITPDSPVGRRLDEVNQSLYAILQYSFFRTKDMAIDLDQQGVLPILFVFLARTNNQILDVQYVGLDKNAQLQMLDKDPAGSDMVPGVKISFVSEGESQPKTLYYFSTDLSNEGLEETPEFLEFVKNYQPSITYLKAASYLMHNESFSTIRDLVLSESSYVLQDDSGMPVRYFEEANWNRQFYGDYVSPIPLFAERYQPDLREIYKTDSNIKPIGFGIGYKFYNDANLMLATSKKKAGN